jgi:hypothetical protein
MKSFADRELLARRARISSIASMGGMLILLAGVAIPMWAPEYSNYSMYMIIGGFAISNIGIFFANRWVKKPRPEDVLDEALKKLNNQNACYHYLLPQEHVLLTPSGVVVMETCTLDGKFTYRNGKWRQQFTVSRALRFFVEETLGDPIAQALADAKTIQALLAKHISEAVPVDGMVVFTSPRAEYEAKDPPIPVVQPDKLSKRLPQHPKLLVEVVEQVRAVLDQAAGLDK